MSLLNHQKYPTYNMPQPKPQPAVEMGMSDGKKISIFDGPAARFRLSGKKMSGHHNLVDSESFDTSSDAAMCQFVADLAVEATDLNAAACVGFRLRGAVEFLERFKTLGEMPKAPKRPDNLDNLRSTEPYRRP